VLNSFDYNDVLVKYNIDNKTEHWVIAFVRKDICVCFNYYKNVIYKLDTNSIMICAL
jgi:hypothetical protein